MLKVEELRNLTEEELSEKAEQLRKSLMQLRFQAKTGKLERQSSIKETRRDIARILTLMNEKSVTPQVVVSAKPSGGKKGVKS